MSLFLGAFISNVKTKNFLKTFYNLEEYTKALYNELKYIEKIEEKYLKM